RQKNLRKLFTLSEGGKDVLAGKTVALLDDVVTTTATTREISRLLLEQGAGEVHVWALARTPALRPDSAPPQQNLSQQQPTLTDDSGGNHRLPLRLTQQARQLFPHLLICLRSAAVTGVTGERRLPQCHLLHRRIHGNPAFEHGHRHLLEIFHRLTMQVAAQVHLIEKPDDPLGTLFLLLEEGDNLFHGAER